MLVGRTPLFVPGDRPDRIGRALASDADADADADAVDLEDAVAPAAKADARAAVPAAVAAGPPHDGLYLRVNALDGPDFADDLGTVAELLPHLSGVRLPRVQDTDAVRRPDACSPRLCSRRS